jgi:ribonuclease BN (tRNA processing enzyme)
MRIHFIGCSNANPNPGFGQTGILLECAAGYYLLDCGDAVPTKMWLDPDLDWSQFRAVFFSHLHQDHLGGVFSFLLLVNQRAKLHPEWALGRNGEFPLYVPDARVAELAAELNEIMHSSCYNPVFRTYQGPGTIHADEDVSVEAFLTAHSRGSHAFRIRAEGKQVVFSGDIRNPDEIAEIAEESDTLIVEGAHFGLSALEPALAGRGIRRVFVTHLLDERIADWENTQQELAGLAAQTDLCLARDGMKVEV